MLSFGASGKKSAPVAYEPRPPIVTPPNTASLPAPGSGATVQNWPTDPDVLAANKRSPTPARGHRIPAVRSSTPASGCRSRRSTSSTTSSQPETKSSSPLPATRKRSRNSSPRRRAAPQARSTPTATRFAPHSPSRPPSTGSPIRPPPRNSSRPRRGAGTFSRKRRTHRGPARWAAAPTTLPTRQRRPPSEGSGLHPLRASKNRLSRAADSLPLIPE